MQTLCDFLERYNPTVIYWFRVSYPSLKWKCNEISQLLLLIILKLHSQITSVTWQKKNTSPTVPILSSHCWLMVICKYNCSVYLWSLVWLARYQPHAFLWVLRNFHRCFTIVYSKNAHSLKKCEKCFATSYLILLQLLMHNMKLLKKLIWYLTG